MSKGSPFDNSTVYHSHLVRETQDNGPLEITLLSDEPEPSKFGKGKDKKLQIAFKCFGDTHYYPIENDDCGEALSGLKGQTVSITASGRDDEAAIEVQNGEPRSSRSSRRDSDRGERQERSEHGHREQKPEREQHRPSKEEQEAEARKEFTKAKMAVCRAAVLYEACLRAATQLANAHFGTPCSSEDIRGIAATLFIESKNSVNIHKLPLQYLEKTAAKEQPPERKPEPEPERQPERKKPYGEGYDDAEEDDIPF